MNFLKSLLSKTRRKDPDISTSPSFADEIRKAIILLHHAPSGIEDKDVLILLAENGIASNEAEEILLFLPIAFVRHLLPKISWPDFYSEMRQDKTRTKKSMESPFYRVIWAETEMYFKKSPNSETVIKIASRSAEFHCINDLLLKAGDGGNINDINVTPTVVIR